MSWYAKVGRVTAPVLLFVGTSAVAAHIDFGGSRDGEARLETRLVATNAEVAPVELHLTIPGIDVDKQSDGFDALQAKGLVPMTTPGNPELFATGSLVAVPDGYEPEVQVVREDDRDVPHVVARPAQRKFRCATPGADTFAYNASVYASRGMYPASVVTLEEAGDLQGLRLVRVALNPMRLSPADQKLTVTTDLVARVTFRKVREGRRLRLTKPMYDLVRGTLANGQGLGRSVDGDTTELMVVVVADSLKSSVDSLVEWKQSRGITVDVVTATQAGGTNDKIQSFLKDYYTSHDPKPSYFLFVGNKTTLPTFMESTASGSAASDWRYTLMGGKENIPDVLYGRLAADNAKEVEVQVNRWIEYEKTPESHGAWYNQGTTIASGEGSGPSDKEYAEQIQAALKSGTYKGVDGFYQGEGTATSANIKGALVDGRSWLTYIGHGSGTSWGSTNDTFNVSTVESLSNSGKLPIIIDVACQNGSWVKISKCFGKAWVTQTSGDANAGAVSYYGGSVNVSWHEPAVMAVGVSKAHFEKPVRTVGGSVLAGQLYLVEKMGTGSNVVDNIKWYNLLGDPSLVVRTDTPVAYEVQHSASTKEGRTTVQVTATDGTGKGVAGLVASVNTDAGSPLAVGTTDAQGRVTLTLAEAIAANTVLTTTGYNAETKQVVLK